MTVRQTRLISYIVGLALSTGAFIVYCVLNKTIDKEIFNTYFQFLQWATVAFIGSKSLTSVIDSLYIGRKKNDNK